jgi:hypothetical protein
MLDPSTKWNEALSIFAWRDGLNERERFNWNIWEEPVCNTLHTNWRWKTIDEEFKRITARIAGHRMLFLKWRYSWSVSTSSFRYLPYLERYINCQRAIGRYIPGESKIPSCVWSNLQTIGVLSLGLVSGNPRPRRRYCTKWQIHNKRYRWSDPVRKYIAMMKRF